MKRRAAAAVMILLFFILFFFSSVNAGMGVDEFKVEQTISFPNILFSLSSAAVLLLPLSLALMAFATWRWPSSATIPAPPPPAGVDLSPWRHLKSAGAAICLATAILYAVFW